MLSGVNSQIIVKTGNVGDSSTIYCDLLNAQWYKNGTKLDETLKVKPTDSSLHIFCLELSDNGIYECRNESNAHLPRNYNLTVKNPDSREFFHIYNKDKNKCLSRLSSTPLHVEDCNLQSCRQKWMWTADAQLVNVNTLQHRECISTDQPAESSALHLQSCSQNSLRWECNNTLVKLKDYDLYLNANEKNDVKLFSYTGPWSHWVKNTTGDNICSVNRKAKARPPHVVISERKAVKVICEGINFYKPTYSWLKNGVPLSGSASGLSLLIHSDVMFMPFAYIKSSGNYTCVVKDHWGTATASTVVEVYKDPSVIRHSLNRKALFGKDICLTCEMFASNTTYEISWSSMGSPISSGNPKYKVNNMTARKSKKFSTELCIKSLNRDDSGMYSCEINYATKGVYDYAQGKLQVLVKPEVHIYKSGEHFLVCNATGFPPPRLTWYKDNKDVENNIMNKEKSLTIKKSGGNLTCVASNSAGTATKSFIYTVGIKGSGSSLTLIIILCVIGLILLLILVILCVCYFRRKKKAIVNNNYEGVYSSVRYTATPGESTSQSQYTTVDAGPPHLKSRIEFQPRTSSDSESAGAKRFGLKAKYQSLKPRAKGEWEVPHECVKFNKKLGEGQFGLVWKGEILARKGSRTVAIKMLHEGASAKDRKALIDELEFMKTMSPHPNIVGLVGCCTRSEQVLIIVEYVPGGNLKDYLLNTRCKGKDIYANLAPFSATLTSKDLLTFGYQIARGMSHLEQIKCVHRDLAARNILIGDDKTCKIADFGLARDIYCENYYRKTSGGRLPLRWMAYESIFNGITTSQSDAWSFGVLLWEIVTLGGNPYPDMNRDQIIDGLQRGYRMPKPHHCSDEIYTVMWECWQQNPDKRPTFAELTATFLRLISLQQIFINMESFGEVDYVNVGSFEETADA
ncbi:fibroblast growth factor receptor 4-like isoform X1 [Paramuricea clavata]|uniref:Tyrosine-protein kinase receptor n=1 Tax=Paramuricea clavata TaxID=317549 RepID=A0A7D9EPN4_PARCT|nr:fibroblast growth factor receptor 4-like isoform X1 [Paramuricea clavata]